MTEGFTTEQMAEANFILADGKPRTGTPFYGSLIVPWGFTTWTFEDLGPWVRFSSMLMAAIVWSYMGVPGIEVTEGSITQPDEEGYVTVGSILKIYPVARENTAGGGFRWATLWDAQPKVYRVEQFDPVESMYVLRYPD